MARSFEFFFDYGSPYSFLADTQLPALAERTGAEIVYRPMLLGGVFKATGNQSPAFEPVEAKRAYGGVELRRQVGVDTVRPGLTGWAQINGRDEIELEEKVRLDRFYVENCSLMLDLRIVMGTFGAVRRSDADLCSRFQLDPLRGLGADRGSRLGERGTGPRRVSTAETALLSGSGEGDRGTAGALAGAR